MSDEIHDEPLVVTRPLGMDSRVAVQASVWRHRQPVYTRAFPRKTWRAAQDLAAWLLRRSGIHLGSSRRVSYVRAGEPAQPAVDPTLGEREADGGGVVLLALGVMAALGLRALWRRRQ